MKRADLLASLQRVQPALATKDFVAVFACFCFAKEAVFAYDDVVAMHYPCKAPIKGAVRGEVLLSWLSSTKAKDLDINQEGQELTLKVGRSRLKTALLPSAEFVFKIPTDSSAELKITESLADAMRVSMISLGQDPIRPWQAGLTLDFGDKSVTIYSTNNLTATLAKVPVKVPKELRGKNYLLPPRFCELLADLTRRDKGTSLLFGKSWVEAQFKSGLRLYSRIGKQTDIPSFKRVFSSKLISKLDTMVDIPKALDDSLARAEGLVKTSKDPTASLNVADGKLIITASSAIGNLKDTLKLKEHDDVTVEAHPTLLRKALSHSEQFLIVPDTCIGFKGKSFTHVVSIAREED